MGQSRRLWRLDPTSVVTPIADTVLKYREWRSVPVFAVLRYDLDLRQPSRAGS